jgi:hypothetical protein
LEEECGAGGEGVTAPISGCWLPVDAALSFFPVVDVGLSDAVEELDFRSTAGGELIPVVVQWTDLAAVPAGEGEVHVEDREAGLEAHRCLHVVLPGFISVIL